MRNVVMLAVAAGLVLPSAAYAQRGPDSRDRGREVNAERPERSTTNQSPYQVRQESRERYQREQRREDRRDARQDRREDRQDWRQDRREDRQDARRDARQDARQDARRDAYRDAYRDARRDARQDYRRDQRQDYRRDQRRAYRDWRAYRQAERHAFRRGAYYAPRGYNYRRVSVGQRLLTSLFWGQSYWINPYDYYLPQPRYGYERWIRYGNDVLLIDTRNGRVLVVYDNFFW